MSVRFKNIITRPTGDTKIDLFMRDVVEVVKQFVLNVFTATTDGLVPAPKTKTGKLLSDNGTWVAPSIVAIAVSRNSGATIGTRPEINLIEGTNITLSVVDDAANNEVDVTISAAPSTVPNGDKGDITVSGTGDIWTIDPAAVTYSKIQNVTDARLLGRSAGSAGVTQEITVASPITLSSGAVDFDETVTLGNNARVAVSRNTVLVGTRRRINLIEGVNTFLTVADDAGNEEVDVTINGATTGNVTVTVPYSSTVYTATVTNAAITPSSRIIITPGIYSDTDVNQPDVADGFVRSVTTGSMELTVKARNSWTIGGDFKFSYLIG